MNGWCVAFWSLWLLTSCAFVVTAPRETPRALVIVVSLGWPFIVLFALAAEVAERKE